MYFILLRFPHSNMLRTFAENPSRMPQHAIDLHLPSFRCRNADLNKLLHVPTRFYTLGGWHVWSNQRKNNIAYSLVGVATAMADKFNYGDFPHSDPQGKLTYQNLPKGELYHPVKCVADLSSGNAALYWSSTSSSSSLPLIVLRPSRTLSFGTNTFRYDFSTATAINLAASKHFKPRKLVGLVVEYTEWIKWLMKGKDVRMEESDVIFVMWCYGIGDRTLNSMQLKIKELENVLCVDSFGVWFQREVVRHKQGLLHNVLVDYGTKVLGRSSDNVRLIKNAEIFRNIHLSQEQVQKNVRN